MAEPELAGSALSLARILSPFSDIGIDSGLAQYLKSTNKAVPESIEQVSRRHPGVSREKFYGAIKKVIRDYRVATTPERSHEII